MKEQQNLVKQFNCSFPAIDLPSKNYSLQADIITGWTPKLKIIGPIPLNFDCRITDDIVQQLTSFGKKYKERVIYLGHRYLSSFKLQQQIKKKYQYKHQAIINSNFAHLAAYFRKFHTNFKSKHSRLFKGMNPTIKPNEQFIFDSNFESGNLDAAIKVGQWEYDIFMRVDTNTRGHIQWFNFTVKNTGKRKIKINIVNFRKYKTLYSRGMKPYFYSSYLNQTKNQGWTQGCYNVQYDIKKIRYQFLDQNYSNQALTYNCLKFQYIFQSDTQTVQFAYCPPFTYSDNCAMITSLIKAANSSKKHHQHQSQQPQNKQQEECIIKQQPLCDSLGGLELPLLTITDPNVSNAKKKCILISGRIHPGQTCGSFMIKGFLEFICSDCEQAKYLRKSIVFKVIPMMNPDGVVVGNYRTSLCGVDLNRMFRKDDNAMLIPQVRSIKSLVLKLKSEFKNRLIFFIDFHGHSVKRNVFLYGPQYEIWENNYYRTRIFPKIISNKTQIFRYYSCLFRIADFKRSTARAVILRNIPHCYTIEASVGGYYSSEEKKDYDFSPKSWQFIGRTTAESIKDYFQLLEDEEFSKIQRKNKLKEVKCKSKSNKTKNRSEHQGRQGRINQSMNGRQNKSRNSRNMSKAEHKQDHSQSPTKKQTQVGGLLSQKARMLIEQIKNDDKNRKQKRQLDDPHDSDNFSEGGSDSEGPDDDLSQKELNSYHQQMECAMKEFKDRFYNKDSNYNDSHLIFKPKPKLRSSIQFPTKKIEMIASLRKKIQEPQPQNKSEKGTAKILHKHWPRLKNQFLIKSAQNSLQSSTAPTNFIELKQISKTEDLSETRHYLREDSNLNEQNSEQEHENPPDYARSQNLNIIYFSPRKKRIYLRNKPS